MLPLRAIAEVFGVPKDKIIWNDSDKSVLLMLSERAVWLQIDNDVMTINGVETRMIDANGISVTPILSNGSDGGEAGRTYVPLRQLAEVVFEFDVLWIPEADGSSAYAVLNPTQTDIDEAERIIQLRAVVTTPDKSSVTEAPPPVKYITIKGERYPNTLTELNLSSDTGWKNADIAPLREMTDLTYLSIFGNFSTDNLTDVTVLGNLTKLETLRLCIQDISDLTPIGKLTNLTELDLWSNKNIRDISPLGNLTNLTKLNLMYADISDLRPLSKLTMLTELSIGGYNTTFTDINALSSLTNLTRLGLYESDVSDLRPIENLTKLESLALGRTKVSDLRPLSKLTNLAFLGMDSLVISDYSPLFKLPKLTSIDFQSSNINDDLYVLSRFPYLTDLGLFNCGIKDLTALESLKNLKDLNLDYNPLTQQQIDRLRLKLPGCSIRYMDPDTIYIGSEGGKIEITL